MHELLSWPVIKRLYECACADPQFYEHLQKDGEGTLLLAGLDIPCDAALHTLESMKDTTYEEHPYFALYLPRVKDILAETERRLAPDNFAMQDYFSLGLITKKRMCVQNSLLRSHPNVRYFPVIFELSEGCSVGCSFCGLGAEKLSKVFFHTDENAALWKEVLSATRELVGQAAGTGVCYFATEPFDNPDYELFVEDFKRVFGHTPQTTTAVADRDTERFRNFIRSISEEDMYNAAVRISVRTKEQFYDIMRLFSPEELSDIEIIPNNPESVNRYAASGRARDEKNAVYSISCLAGLRVNMAAKKVTYEEPELSCDEFPTGERIYGSMPFTDAGSFRRAVSELSERFLRAGIKNEDVIVLPDGVHVEINGNEAAFFGDGAVLRVTGNRFFTEGVKLLSDKGISLAETGKKLYNSDYVMNMFREKLERIFEAGYLRCLPKELF